MTSAGRRHDKKGRSTPERLRKQKPKISPRQCGVEQFGWFPLEMMEHEAFRALSPNARRLLDRLLIEHVHQGGVENGRLVVPHQALRDYGLHRNRIRESIDECVAFGFIRVTAGGRWAGTNRPNKYRLTWLGSTDDHGAVSDPTNDWKGITPDFIARWQGQRTENRSAKRRWRETRKTDRTPKSETTVVSHPRLRTVK